MREKSNEISELLKNLSQFVSSPFVFFRLNSCMLSIMITSASPCTKPEPTARSFPRPWDTFPANTTHWPTAGLMYAQLLRRWPNNKPALGQWLQPAALPMSLPAVGFEPRLVQDCQKNIRVILSLYWDTVSMLYPWARHFTPTCFTWLSCKWVPGREEMAMCTISSMRRDGCRTVCSP